MDPEQLQLSFEDFKSLLTLRDADPIEWAINSNQNRQTQISASEMHLIRQILLLTHRKLQDIGHVVRTLRPYKTSDIFDYLVNFNRPRSKQLNPNLLTNGTQRNKSVPRLSGHFVTDSQGRIVESNNDTNKRGGERSPLSRRLRGTVEGRGSGRPNRDSMDVGTDRRKSTSLLNKFVKLPTMESPLRLEGNNENGAEEIDVETLCNFLEFKEVKINSEDTVFILYDCGVKGNSIRFEDFQEFMDCWLWN